MKRVERFMFIELCVHEGERIHNHRVLHVTYAKNLDFVANRYAASYWGFGERESRTEDFWWFHGEITVSLHRYKELTEKEYNTMFNIFHC